MSSYTNLKPVLKTVNSDKFSFLVGPMVENIGLNVSSKPGCIPQYFSTYVLWAAKTRREDVPTNI